MRKVLLVIVSMVLLSGAAWGQPKDALIIGGINGTKDLTMEWHIANMHPEWVKSGNTFYMWYEPKKPKPSPLKGHMEDPTSWKQTDSRYRLEKNEVTGNLRIAEFKLRNNKWNGICDDRGNGVTCSILAWDNAKNETLVPDFDGFVLTEKQMVFVLDYLRRLEVKEKSDKELQEREDRAWKPIR